jgi:hypothetical protein
MVQASPKDADLSLESVPQFTEQAILVYGAPTNALLNRLSGRRASPRAHAADVNRNPPRASEEARAR